MRCWFRRILMKKQSGFGGYQDSQTSTWRKKQLVNLAKKNARVGLEQKFNLLEKSVEKTQGAIENLDACFKFQPQFVSNLSITPTSWGPVLFQPWWSLPTANQVRRIIVVKIKTVVGPNDYASMREVIRRRYGQYSVTVWLARFDCDWWGDKVKSISPSKSSKRS